MIKKYSYKPKTIKGKIELMQGQPVFVGYYEADEGKKAKQCNENTKIQVTYLLHDDAIELIIPMKDFIEQVVRKQLISTVTAYNIYAIKLLECYEKAFKENNINIITTP